MGPIPSEGGARSAWRAGLSVALCLSILGMADAASGQSLRNGFYTGLELGRANASPLTSSVTGVNHPTRCDRLLYPASTSPPASDEACRASTPTVILRNAFDLGGGAVSGLLAGYRADRVRVEVEYLTRSQGPATAAVGATTNVVLQGKDTEWSDDQPPREWIRDYAAHQIPCRPQILDLETIAVTQRALAVVDSPPPVVVVLVAVPPRGQRAVQARSALQALGRFSVAGGPA